MGKLSLQDLAAILVDKAGIESEEAQIFVSSVFNVIQEGIERDKLVKIKGLGTFKVIEVDARESINVNTGERVLIKGHSKISFTPDSTMKELVNKPFSGFDTVLLNDGVNFEDTKQLDSIANAELEVETEADPSADPQQEVVQDEDVQDSEEKLVEVAEIPQVDEQEHHDEAPPQEDRVEDVEVSDDEPQSNDAEEPVEVERVEEESAEEPLAEETGEEPLPQAAADDQHEDIDAVVSLGENAPEDGSETQDSTADVEQKEEEMANKNADIRKANNQEDDQDDDDPYTFYPRKKVYPWKSWFIAAAIGGVIGYAIGRFQEIVYVVPSTVEYIDATATAEDDDAENTDSAAATPAQLEAEKKKDTASATAPTAKPKEEKPAAVQNATATPAKTDSRDYLKYEEMDARLRTGAYYIMGVASVEKAREGDNISRISRRYFGEGMSCYVEVLNGLKASTPLKEGQEVKIPKLVEKRKVKQQNNSK